MSLRRSLIAIVVVLGFAASIVAARHTDTTTVTRFATAPFASRPYASHSTTSVTTTWYCPGVPASGPTVGGQFVIGNPTTVAITGTITYLGPEGTVPITAPVTVAPRDELRLDAQQAMTAPIVAATIELQGGEGLVEQRAQDPAGQAVASCTTETSSTWYLADGWTRGTSTDQLIISNPYSDNIAVNIAFFTAKSKREPGPLQGASIAPHSVRVISIEDSGFAGESVIGVQVVAERGRVIVAREQHYALDRAHDNGDGRVGFSLAMAAPTPSDQVWFVEGDHGTDITEQYVILNPTNEDVAVDLVVLGIPVTNGYAQPDSISVPANQVVTFDTKDITGLPDGPHSMVFSTLVSPSTGSAKVVIERVLTKPSGGGPVTTVVMGMTSEYVVPRWYVPIGVDTPTEGAIVVYNPDQVDKTIAIKAIGPGGEVAVPGQEAVPLPAAATRTIDLTDPSLLGKMLVIEGSARIFVERKLPRGADLPGRSGSWALPECGPCNFSSPPSS